MPLASAGGVVVPPPTVKVEAGVSKAGLPLLYVNEYDSTVPATALPTACS